jgi:hypothetical protein
MRTFTTKGRKVGAVKGAVCEYCGYAMQWRPGWCVLPSRWSCPNTACVAQELEDEEARNYYDDEPDWTQA